MARAVDLFHQLERFFVGSYRIADPANTAPNGRDVNQPSQTPLAIWLWKRRFQVCGFPCIIFGFGAVSAVGMNRDQHFDAFQVQVFIRAADGKVQRGACRFGGRIQFDPGCFTLLETVLLSLRFGELQAELDPVAGQLALVKGIALEHLADVTRANFERLFGREAVQIFQLTPDQQYLLLGEGEPPDAARDKRLLYAALNAEAARLYDRLGRTELARASRLNALRFALRASAASSSYT